MSFSQRHSLLVVFFLVFALVTGSEASHRRIARGKSRLSHRDAAPYNGPTSLQTTQSIVTAGGVLIETCNITLTPIVGPDGENLVREEKTCTLSSPSPTETPDAPAATTPSAVAVTTSVEVTTLTGTPTLTTTGATETPAAKPSSEPSETPDTETPAETPTPRPAALGSASATPSVTATLAAQTVGAAAAAESVAPSETPLNLPGKSLSVLPIGLGIFAGISVIALVVIALVTYERTKHRKAFRERKLAEAGAGMGSGGGYGATAA
ncbi:hypothetical protein BOTBODRAFT_168738 [Botryobasidium botryosum FD-172 SS1]|uniref:Mid2 domain-containing protein n=1 Tax=Botryobasidium botryosum (strain FD-172 SS1) TaxID=930990 RepID=A0A067N0U9_BOTB1|nr:hypothetical protein BOTBODRAFT_168738 [Botryobasidium botryosum FD-172 SS1]